MTTLDPNYKSLRLNRSFLTGSLTLMLAACGGADIKFHSPTDEGVFSRNENIEFSIEFVKLDSSTASFYINDEDVSSSFDIDTETDTATASIASSGLLDEHNVFTVITDGKTENIDFYVDRSGPEFHITSVSPSFLLATMDVTVQGYVTDLSEIQTEGIYMPRVMMRTSNTGSQSLANIELNENNEFSVTFNLPQDPDGATGLEYRDIYFRAYDSHRFRSNDAYAFPTQMPQLSKAKVTDRAFDSIINPEVNDLLDSLNVESLIRAENPVVDKGWSIFSFQIHVTNFDMDDIQVELRPDNSDGFHVVASVDAENLDVSIRTQVTADIPGPNPGVFVPSGLHHADIVGDVSVRFRVDGNNNSNPVLVVDGISPDLRVIGGDFDAIDFGFPFDLPGLGTLEQLIFEALDNYLANKIGSIVGDKAADKINDMLELIPNDFDVTLRNKTLNFYLSNATVNASNSGIEVAITEADVFTAVNQRESDVPKELGPVIHQTRQALPGFSSTAPNGQGFDAALSLDWNFLNKTIYYAHAAGIDRFETTIAGDQIPGVREFFKDYELEFRVRPLVSPHLDHAMPKASRALASVQAKNVEITVNARRTDIVEDFQQVTRMIVNARADFDLSLLNNRLNIFLDENPRVDIHSVDNEHSLLILEEEHIQALVDFAIPQVMPRLADAIETIKLPSLAGYRLSVVDIETVSDRFFKIYADINETGGGVDLVIDPPVLDLPVLKQ